MIRNPIDITTRVSPELSSLIEGIVNELETGEPITLAMIRTLITQDLPVEINESEQMHHFDVDESLVDELDALIDGFGESAAAVDFVYSSASEQLSRVIEAVMDDENLERPATLEDVREAVVSGFASSLVGEGVMEEDEDDMLLSEIENLIDRFGPDAPAEDFLRYE